MELADAPRARALLRGDRKPCHAGLDLAYQEAIANLQDLETQPGRDTLTRIESKWAALTHLTPGCTIPQRMDALKKFYGGH